MKLLITADPGARSNFVAAWLQDRLRPGLFDVGTQIGGGFIKCHTDWNNQQASNFPGKKIRLQTSFDMLHLHLYLFLMKNVYPQIPTMDPDQFSFAVTNKLIESAKEWFLHDQQIDQSLYGRVLTIADTFKRDCMIDLYQWYNGSLPVGDYVMVLDDVNQINLVSLPANHSCCISALILEKEHRLGLCEIERAWSLSEIYENTASDQLYATIDQVIHPDNYGRSDVFGQGVNETTKKLAQTYAASKSEDSHGTV